MPQRTEGDRGSLSIDQLEPAQIHFRHSRPSDGIGVRPGTSSGHDLVPEVQSEGLRLPRVDHDREARGAVQGEPHRPRIVDQCSKKNEAILRDFSGDGDGGCSGRRLLTRSGRVRGHRGGRDRDCGKDARKPHHGEHAAPMHVPYVHAHLRGSIPPNVSLGLAAYPPWRLLDTSASAPMGHFRPSVYWRLRLSAHSTLPRQVASALAPFEAPPSDPIRRSYRPGVRWKEERFIEELVRDPVDLPIGPSDAGTASRRPAGSPDAVSSSRASSVSLCRRQRSTRSRRNRKRFKGASSSLRILADRGRARCGSLVFFESITSEVVMEDCRMPAASAAPPATTAPRTDRPPGASRSGHWRSIDRRLSGIVGSRPGVCGCYRGCPP